MNSGNPYGYYVAFGVMPENIGTTHHFDFRLDPELPTEPIRPLDSSEPEIELTGVSSESGAIFF